jgi:CspA family cold shock protein
VFHLAPDVSTNHPHPAQPLSGAASGKYNLKRISEMPTGTVKFFIEPEGGGPDSFVHISDVERSGLTTLREKQRVTYDIEQDQRGKMKATNLQPADNAD